MSFEALTVKLPRLWLFESGMFVPPNTTETGPPDVLLA